MPRAAWSDIEMKADDAPARRDRTDAHQRAARDPMDAGELDGLDLDALLAKAEDAPEPYGSTSATWWRWCDRGAATCWPPRPS